jgi:hypothetical protein
MNEQRFDEIVMEVGRVFEERRVNLLEGINIIAFMMRAALRNLPDCDDKMMLQLSIIDYITRSNEKMDS